jgi:hypothetical protein
MCHKHTDITSLHPATHDSSLDICASSTTSPASGGHLSPLKGGTLSPALTYKPDKVLGYLYQHPAEEGSNTHYTSTRSFLPWRSPFLS